MRRSRFLALLAGCVPAALLTKGTERETSGVIQNNDMPTPATTTTVSGLQANTTYYFNYGGDGQSWVTERV